MCNEPVKSKLNRYGNSLKRTVLTILFSVLLLELAGCGNHKNTEVIFTTDFKENEVFRIEDMSCYIPEIMVYLVNSENRYDEIFGEQIWQVPTAGSTVEKEYKETILARIAQIKVMNLLAGQYEVSLDEAEIASTNDAAAEYFNSLNPREVSVMGVDMDIIGQLYREFALANKLYGTIIGSIQPEISDDEARAVTVRSIHIKTYSITNDGTRIEYTAQQKQAAFDRTMEAYKKILDGTDFDVVAADYNEDSESTYSFGRGVMPERFEDAAFNLETDELSSIIETSYGYHIIKCISKFDRDETDANKEEIVKKKQQEAFNEIYDEFVTGLTSNLNSSLWESISYEKIDGVNTTSFFDVFDKYFDY